MTMFSPNVIDYSNTSEQMYNDSLLNYGILVTSGHASLNLKVGRWLIIVIRPILVILKTIGNSLALVVIRRGSLREVSTCFYMAILAIADTSK